VKTLSDKLWKKKGKKECNKRLYSEDVKLALQFSRMMTQLGRIEILVQDRGGECLNCIVTSFLSKIRNSNSLNGAH